MSEERDFAADNLQLAFVALNAFADDAAALDDVPEGKTVKVISYPVNDPELLAHNINVMATEIARRMPPGTESDITVRPPRKKSATQRRSEQAAEDSWRMAPAGV